MTGSSGAGESGWDWSEHTSTDGAMRRPMSYRGEPPSPAPARRASPPCRPPRQVAQHGCHVGPSEPPPEPLKRADRDPGGAGRVVRGPRLAAPPAGGVVEVHHRETPEAADEVGVPVEPEPGRVAHAEPGLL